MESKIYRLTRIEGEYAYITDVKTSEELFIAMALLPLGVDIGTMLEYNFPDFTIIG